ncbi:MAG: hypothetical protein AAGF46_06020 [Pseudomonadota bacterium]
MRDEALRQSVLRETARVVFDPAIVFFCGIIALPLTVGLNLLGTILLIVPALLLILFSTSALMKYSALVARSIAMGHPVPSAESAVFDYFRMPWAFAPWLATVLVVAVGFTLQLAVDARLAALFTLIMVPLWPVAMGIVSVNARPLTIFAVPALIRVLRIVGLDYLKVLGVWLAFGAALAFAPVALLVFPGLVSVFMITLQTLALFAAMGLVLFRHRHALGLWVERESVEERMALREHKQLELQRRTALDQAYQFFSRGNSHSGQQRMASYFSEFPDDKGAWPWFLDEMMRWEATRPASLLGQNYFRHLLAAGDTEQAKAVLQRCLLHDGEFVPHPDDRARARELLAGSALAERATRWR